MIVPVWLSSTQKPEREVLVYAMLHTQSDTSFVKTAVADELSEGADTFPSISTIPSKWQELHCRRYNDLQVRGFHSTERLDIPEAYSQDDIPVDRSHVPDPASAKQLDHLKTIAREMVPLKDCP